MGESLAVYKYCFIYGMWVRLTYTYQRTALIPRGREISRTLPDVI